METVWWVEKCQSDDVDDDHNNSTSCKSCNDTQFFSSNEFNLLITGGLLLRKFHFNEHVHKKDFYDRKKENFKTLRRSKSLKCKKVNVPKLVYGFFNNKITENRNFNANTT